MPKREHHEFQDINKWDTELTRAAIKFREKYGVYPNIFLASIKTHSKIDSVANVIAPEKFFGLKGNEVIQKPFSELGGIDAFSTDDFFLPFCVDSSIPYPCFALVYDPNAEFLDAKKALSSISVYRGPSWVG